MKKILISFGNWDYYSSLQKLKLSAEIKGHIDSIVLFKDSDIDPDFYKKYIRHFCDGRGFGYWVWKAYFIKKIFNSIDDDVAILYVDAGNEVIDDLTPLYDVCSIDEKGVVLFNNCDNPDGIILKNNQWTKSDCFNLMGLNTAEYINGDQVNASYILFRKTNFSAMFFDEFFNACKNYNIISDAPNVTEDFNKDFVDHRHDQSVLSLLSIKYKITILRDPSQYGKHRQFFDHHRKKYLDMGYFLWCADEGESIHFSQQCDVAYGVKGSLKYLYNQVGDILFNNTTFGCDPAPNQLKKGYYRNISNRNK